MRIAGRYSVAPSGGTRLLTMKPRSDPSTRSLWNFPWPWATRKIGPALAAGCPIVTSPLPDTAHHARPGGHSGRSRVAGRSGQRDHHILLRQGLGADHRDPRLRKLTFTGSTSVGQKLIEQSAKQVLKISMELGGNAPFLVFGDADLDAP